MKAAWMNPSMLLTAALMSGAVVSSAYADPAGEKLFKQQCAACHAVAADAPRGLGPNLLGIVGRAAGQMTGFPYSNEFKKGMADKTWSPELLDAWLEDPQNLAPGTYMMYKQGDAAIRKSIIDYLQTAK